MTAQIASSVSDSGVRPFERNLIGTGDPDAVRFTLFRRSLARSALSSIPESVNRSGVARKLRSPGSEATCLLASPASARRRPLFDLSTHSTRHERWNEPSGLRTAPERSSARNARRSSNLDGDVRAAPERPLWLRRGVRGRPSRVRGLHHRRLRCPHPVVLHVCGLENRLGARQSSRRNGGQMGIEICRLIAMGRRRMHLSRPLPFGEVDRHDELP